MAKAETLGTYIYQGVDRKGNKVKGELPGRNSALVKAELRKQGINANKISKKLEIPFLGGGGGKKITTTDITIFTRQMATMMKAGVPLVQSLDIVADGLDNPTMREVVMKIKGDVEAGGNLAQALTKHPDQFDELFCNLVDAGEQSGALETMLDRVAIYKEKAEAVRLKIKKAMKYPITVLIIAAVVTGILLVKVVPTFEKMFESFGGELPALTKMVIVMSEWMQAWWFIILAMVGGAVFAFGEAKKRSKAFADKVDELVLRLPIFGDILYKGIIARFARTLSTTFAAGVPLIDALEACAGAAGNSVFYKAIMTIRDDVSTGTQLQFSMRSTNLFPSMALQMVAIGEESGALDAMLDKVATYFEDEVDNAVDGLTSMIEPMIMAFLGIVVGGLLVAMYLPIFSIGQAI